MKHQVVLDKRTSRLLQALATDHAGNESTVVRRAIQTYAVMESRLEEIEADPRFQEVMKRADEDMKAGRFLTHEEVKRKLGRNWPARLPLS